MSKPRLGFMHLKLLQEDEENEEDLQLARKKSGGQRVYAFEALARGRERIGGEQERGIRRRGGEASPAREGMAATKNLGFGEEEIRRLEGERRLLEEVGVVVARGRDRRGAKVFPKLEKRPWHRFQLLCVLTAYDLPFHHIPFSGASQMVFGHTLENSKQRKRGAESRFILCAWRL